MKKILFSLLTLLILVSCGSSRNWKNEYAKDFNPPKDQGGLGNGKTFQGFGGIAKKAERKHTPIIFVHGNGGDATNYLKLAKKFHESGYSMQELWSFSYMGVPGTMDRSMNPHSQEVQDLHLFIQAVLEYTGADKVDIIAHSMGSSLSLYWMKQYDTYDKVNTLVAVAGALHGFPDMEGVEWAPAWMEKNIRYQKDETPFGKPKDEKNHVPPQGNKEITYIVVHAGKDDAVVHSFSLNLESPLLEGADATYNLEGKTSPSKENPADFERECGAHCWIIMNPDPIFNVLKNHFPVE
jgi:pimeloyl-ACP methyl ester carboxylesterase